MLSLEEFEQEIISFLKQRGGKTTLIAISKNFGWTVDGKEKIYDVVADMQQKGLITISKNSFGIDIVYIKK